MKRSITEHLIKWKDSPRRKPLILTGVRQCGKTYAVKSFGKECFENLVYVNFEENKRLGGIFDYDFSVSRIVSELEQNLHEKVVPGKTLVFFDEIQECPGAITSLKYFCENLNELHIICAGSLLGVALRKENISFPVGKVNRMQMYPMSFKEFSMACGGEKYLEILSSWSSDRPVPEIYSIPMEKLLKEYYAVGGMPEAVAAWANGRDMAVVEEIQDEIIRDYADDMSKHTPGNEIEKIRWIWDSVPKQLAKENNKFVFSHVKEGKRAAELENSLQWLVDAGLVNRVELVENVELPLSGASDATYFKVYMADIGLLRRKSGITASTLFDGDPLFIRHKGAIAENYVLNELIIQGKKPYFWRSGNTAEVDFIYEDEGKIIPVEVKAADNTRAKSFQQFCRKYNPEKGIKVSMKNLAANSCENTKTLSIPHYLLWESDKLL